MTHPVHLDGLDGGQEPPRPCESAQQIVVLPDNPPRLADSALAVASDPSFAMDGIGGVSAVSLS